jgi:hypothetical protein
VRLVSVPPLSVIVAPGEIVVVAAPERIPPLQVKASVMVMSPLPVSVP